PWLYSFLYNGWYMLAELVITLIVAMILYASLGRYFRREDLR
ncbi:MAG: energy-coupled thiamine transporter ThiT, partial [Clostridia bacterium]|nr:energy-coupled thiamine transporter ThiT [Clostridia bacterium]